jgi:hypothetical protein
MFDLEQAIAEWRRHMLAAGIKTPVPLVELESHLRDEVERQVGAGLSAQQALAAAVQRMGQPMALEAEFAKTADVKEARERKLKLLCLAATALVYLTPFALSGAKPWSRMNPAEQWLGLVALALTVVSIFSGLLLHRFLPVIPDKRVRTRVQFASAVPLFVWLCVFVFVLVPRVEWTVAQLSVATLWAISPLSIFGGLICGLDEAARRKTSAAHA